MNQTTLEQAKALAEDYRMIPISRALSADACTPLEAFLRIKAVSRHCFILESVEHAGGRGRYTFLGYDPKLEITCSGGELTMKGAATLSIHTDRPGEFLRNILEENKSPRLPGLPPFTGGLMGYFSYDYLKYAEPSLKLGAKDEEGFKDVDLMLFDKIVAFDHLKNEIVLIVNARTDAPEENYSKAVLELDSMERLIREGEVFAPAPLKLASDFRALFGKDEYCEMVKKAKRHIFEGDIFQVVLSNRLDADAEGSLFNAYRILRRSNPSPYMFYLSSSDLEIVGASPETLVRLEDGVLTTFPLAGTRPRGNTPEEDQRLEAELLSDEKELAEHNMLVDLGRNDLGKIAEFGSVAVENYLGVQRFSHVMHIGSTVRAQIRRDKSALDALDAVLPAGTLSGAPKLRAMEIIDKLENNKRGIYGGAIGYLDFSGNLDTCIAIRIAYMKNNKVFVRSGAGIVADSVPECEFEECLHKARAVVDALTKSQEGRGA
ncbi:MAG: anthranilate synthase component I [Bacillota bacterium]